MFEVSCVKTISSPDLDTVCDDLSRALDLIGGLGTIVPRASRVMLKPNVGSVTYPHEARNTDPRVIEAMIILLRKLGVKDIIIAESSIVGFNTLEAFKVMGIDEIARKHDVGLVDLKNEPVMKKQVPHPLVLSTVIISSLVDQVDVIINMPKLKTVSSVPVSLSLKNLKGLLPDSEKKRFHLTNLSKAIVDLNQVVKPQLSIIDGIIANEFYEPKETNVLFAGCNGLAVDAVVTTAVGLCPGQVKYMHLAAHEGLGPIDLGQITICGSSLGAGVLDLKTAPDNTNAFREQFPEVNIVDGDACSGCTSSLYNSLRLAKELGLLDNKVAGLNILMGAKHEKTSNLANSLSIGNCTESLGTEHHLPGCPFTSMDFLEKLKSRF